MTQKDLPKSGWYLETSQGLEGPFTLDELRQKTIAGLFPLKQNVLHPEQNLTVPVHDLFPPLDEKLSAKFQPPPRPANIPASNEKQVLTPVKPVDYLAKLTEVAATPAPKPKRKGRFESTRSVVIDQLRRLSGNARAENNPAQALAHGAAQRANMKAAPKPRFRWAYAAIASTAVGFGAAGLARYLMTPPTRELASTAPVVEDVKKPAAPARPLGSSGARAMPSALGDSIGAGKNPVARDLGAGLRPSKAMIEAAKRAATTAQAEPSPTAPAEAPGRQQAEAEPPPQHYDPAQFDLSNNPVTPPDPASAAHITPPPPGPGADGAPQVEDPNRGVAMDPNVSPPADQPQVMEGYVDPAQQAALQQHQQQYPASPEIDPNTGQPLAPPPVPPMDPNQAQGTTY